MKCTVVVTVLNESEDIPILLESLLVQTKKPDEIIVVDGGSEDGTVDIIKTYQKAYGIIRLIERKASRAEARNIGVSLASNQIIATTDSGCIAEKHWLKRLTAPFTDNETDMVAGFYEMLGNSHFRNSLATFIGVTPEKYNDKYIASARSLAFTEKLWESVGGFPENLKDTAEDTLFTYKIIKSGAKIVRVKNAVVYWKLPKSFGEAFWKMYLYAKGDAISGIWWHPTKKLSTHNIKVLFVFLRYVVGLTLLLLLPYFPPLELPLVLGIILYIFWAFRKVYLQTRDILSGLCGIFLQFSSDVAVMMGFLVGISSKE